MPPFRRPISRGRMRSIPRNVLPQRRSSAGRHRGHADVMDRSGWECVLSRMSPRRRIITPAFESESWQQGGPSYIQSYVACASLPAGFRGAPFDRSR